MIFKFNHYLISAQELKQRDDDMLKSYRDEIFSLKKELYEARKTSEPNFDIPVIPIGTLDPEPANGKERLAYAGRVGAFFLDVLKPKLEAMIADAQQELTVVTNTEKYDILLKGTVNAYWKIIQWGASMQSEVQQAQVDAMEANGEKDAREKLEEIIYRG